MDSFTNLNSSFGQKTAATATAVALEKQIDQLQFPGEDGGRSLTAWARRDLEATLQLLADRAQYVTGGSGAAIALRNGDHIIGRASSGPSTPEVGSYLELTSGLSGESVRTRKILRCHDTSADPRVNPDKCQALKIGSFVVMPLVRDDRVIGIFEIFSAHKNALQERDVQALQRLGEMVNTALDQVNGPWPRRVLAGSDAQKIPVQMQGAQNDSSGRRPPSPAEPWAASIDSSTSAAETESLLELLPQESPVESTSSSQADAQPDSQESPIDEMPGSSPAIGTCASCGFPVSPGRAFCLDCEASLPEKFGAVARANTAPAFLTDLADGGPQRSGIGHWLYVHRYLLGIILVLGGTAAMLLLR